MSVIIRTPNNKIKMLCKGADSIIFPRLFNYENVDFTNTALNAFANEGLRTLLIAEKVLSEQEYQSFIEEY